MRRVINTRVVLAIAYIAMATVAIPAATAQQASCGVAEKALADRDLLVAEQEFLKLREEGEACAAALQIVERRQKAVERLVAIGDTLAATDVQGARTAYRRARKLDRRIALAAKFAALKAPAPGAACEQAAKLLSDGFVAQSRAEYLVLRESGEDCAKDGLTTVGRREAAVTSLIAIAKGLRDADDDEAATGVLDDAASLGKESAAVEEAREAIGSDPVYDRAEEQGDAWLEQLRQLGVWLGAALAWLAAVLIALLLVAWLARGIQAFAHRARENVAAFPPDRPAILTATVAGLLVGAAAVIAGVAPVLVLGAMATLAVAAGLVSKFKPIHRLLFRVLLKLETLTTGKDAADAKGLSSQLGAAIRGRVHGQDGPDSSGGVKADDPFDAIATALSAAGPGKVAGTLLKLVRTLLPSRTVQLSGHVHAATGAGCGLSLTLVEGRGHAVGTVTIWHDDIGPAGSEPSEPALRHLAIAGAAWVRHELRREYGVVPHGEPPPSKTSWESEALFQVAATDRAATIQARRALFASALEHDGGNLPALFDAAVLDLRAVERDKAKRRLSLVTEQTKVEKPTKRDLLWFKATYQKAVLELDRSALWTAYLLAGRLLTDLLDQTRETHGGERVAALRRLEGPALVLMASILLTAYKTEGRSSASWRFGDWRDSLIVALRVKAPFREPSRLSAKDMLDFAGKAEVVLTDRMHYNLACYYSRRGALGDRRRLAEAESLRQLELALASGAHDLFDWAAVDSGLEWIRKARPDAMRKLTKAGDPGELARVRAIGPDLALKLEKDHDITTAEALAALDPDERTALAHELDVGDEIVNRWAGLAQLAALPQLSIDHVNLLDEARIRSLADLGDLSGDHLARRLRLVALRRDPTSTPIDLALLDTWVLEARRLSSGPVTAG